MKPFVLAIFASLTLSACVHRTASAVPSVAGVRGSLSEAGSSVTGAQSAINDATQATRSFKSNSQRIDDKAVLLLKNW